MSVLADERALVGGQIGAGRLVTYTLGTPETFRIETIRFQVVTSATLGTRNAVVLYLGQANYGIAAVPDWNDVPAASTIEYTFGIGLEAFCSTLATGAYVQNALPDTVLQDGASVVLAMIDATGNVVAGDTFTSVNLYGARETGGVGSDVIPLLTPTAFTVSP